MKIQIASITLAVMLVQFVLVGESQAQRVRMDGGGAMVGLLTMEKVQKELKLDEESVKKITELATEMRSVMRTAMREAYQDAGGNRAAIRESMAEIQKEFAEKEKKPINELLDDNQMSRLKQLVVQQHGTAMLAKKDFAISIGISEEQFGKINEKYQDFQAEMDEKATRLSRGGDPEGAQKAMKNGTKKMNKEMMAMLTRDQRKKFEAAKGAKFKFPEVRHRGHQDWPRGSGRPRNEF